MKKFLLTSIAFAAVLTSGATFAQSQEGSWMVRARAVNLTSTNNDTTGLGLSIDNKVIPEIDISYFINHNVAVELILSVPQVQTVKSSVVGGDIGTFRHLPPTLTVQYHFDTPYYGIKPYIGAGINYTRIFDVDLTVPGVDISRSSVGGVLQVGVDIPVAKNTYLNFDVKKINLGTDVFSNGSKIGNLGVDPLVVGVGIGWRF